ncbi:MAG: hypothetical protein WBS20_11670 [Lysobacterales bacterium]
MEFRPFSPLHMLIQLLLVVFLLGGTYLYVTWFFKKIEPNAKSATEIRLGVGIERNILGSWKVPAKNLQDYQGSKLFLRTEVFAIQFVLLMLFVAGFLLEFILLYVFFGWLYKGSR